MRHCKHKCVIELLSKKIYWVGQVYSILYKKTRETRRYYALSIIKQTNEQTLTSIIDTFWTLKQP